jgi:hypothetical protein
MEQAGDRAPDANRRCATEHAPAGGTVSLLGYGSLVSGLGLSGLRPLPVRALGRIRLRNCRRGFGKPSQYGDRLAMLLEPLRDDEPIRAERLGNGPEEAERCPEALLLGLGVDDLSRVARREGYRAAAMLALDEVAASQGASVPEYLWSMLAAVAFDRAAYRSELACRLGYTSPHYVPHPVPVDDGTIALTFLAPGDEGSGAPDVVPVRVAAGMTRVLSLAAAWHEKPNRSQLDYFLVCLLGGVHNVSFDDVLEGLDDEAELRRNLAELAVGEVGLEPDRFRAALCLSRDDYDVRFGPGPQRQRSASLCLGTET